MENDTSVSKDNIFAHLSKEELIFRMGKHGFIVSEGNGELNNDSKRGNQMNSIDHEYTNNLICPWCGSEDMESWEIEPDLEELGIVKCDECEKDFYGFRCITIEYVTKKVEYGTCDSCGAKDIALPKSFEWWGKYDDKCQECLAKIKKDAIENFKQ